MKHLGITKRKRRRIELLVLAFAGVVAVGCSSNEHKLVKLEKKYKDKMCACADAKCISDVAQERRTERDKMKGDMKPEEMNKLSESDMKKGLEYSQQYRTCEKELMAKYAASHPRVLEYKRVADQACACKDLACGRAARDSLNKKKGWVSGIMEHTRPHRKRMSKCIMNLMGKPAAK